MSKKKITDPERSMEELIARAVEAAKAPFNSNRAPDFPSLRSVAEQLGTTVIRTRKLLITASYFESPLSRSVGIVRKMEKVQTDVTSQNENVTSRPKKVTAGNIVSKITFLAKGKSHRKSGGIFIF